MRGLFLDSLTSLVGDVFRGVTNSTSRMKESVLFHKEEEEKKHKQMEEKNKKEVAQLRGEVEERNKQIKANEEELKTREKRAKEDEAKHKQELKTNKQEEEKKYKQMEERKNKEVAQLKGEVEERSRKIKEDEANHKQEVANLQKSFHIRIGQFEKKLEDKDGVIGELKKHNAGLRVAFDLNAGVNMQMEDLDAKIEEANLEARNLKRSRQELEETAGPEMKKVCAAVIQLRNEDVATGLKMIEASANIIAPALAMSKNAKRRAQRAKSGGGNGLKGSKYCGICKDFFRLDL